MFHSFNAANTPTPRCWAASFAGMLTSLFFIPAFVFFSQDCLALDVFPIRVTASPGKMMDGPTVMEQVPKGTHLWAVKPGENGWWQVNAPTARRLGWIHVNDIDFPQYSSHQEQQLGIAEALHKQYFALKKAKNFDAAIAKLNEAIAATESLFDADHPTVMNYRESLALCLSAKGQTQEALELLTTVLASWERTLGTHHPSVLRALHNQGLWLKQLNHGDRSRRVLTEAYVRRKHHFGPEHEKTLNTLSLLAKSLSTRGDLVKAKEYYQLLLDGYTKTRDEFDSDRVYAIKSLGNISLRLGEFAAGREMYRSLLKRLRAHYGEDHENVLSAMSAFASGLSDAPLGNGPITTDSSWSFAAGSGYEELIVEARSLRRRIVSVRLEKLGPDDSRTLDAQSLLAHNLRTSIHREEIDEQALHEAIELYQTLIQKRRKRFGDNDKDTIWIVGALIRTLDQTSLYDEALQHRRFLYDVAQANHGPAAPETLAAYLEVIRGLALTGKSLDARVECDQLLELCWQNPGENFDNVSAIGQVLSDLGDTGASLDLWQVYFQKLREQEGLETDRSIRLSEIIAGLELNLGAVDRGRAIVVRLIPVLEKLTGDDSRWDVDTRRRRASEFGYLCRRAGLNDAAVKFHEIAWHLGMGEEIGHLDSSFENLVLGSSLENAGRYKEARPFLARALELLLEGDHRSDTVLPTCISVYASVLLELGDHQAIEQLTAQFQNVFATAQEGKDTDVLRQFHLAAQALARAGQHQSVIEVLDRSVPQMLELLPESHKDIPIIRSAYAEVLLRAGRSLDAFRVVDKLRVSSRAFVASALPLLAPHEQIKFLTTKDRAAFEHALSLAVSLKDQQGIAATSAGWLLNAKAQTQETGGKAYSTSNPRVAELARQLNDVSSRLATLSYRSPSEESQGRIATLETQQRSLHRRLSTAGLNLNTPDPWHALDSVRDRLQPHEVLIDFVRLPVRDLLSHKVIRTDYFAWIIPAKAAGDVEIVEFGDAETIDALIRTWRMEFGRVPSVLGSTSAEQASPDQTSAKELSRRLLTPLESALADDCQRLVLSPDGELWNLPWAALTDENDQFLIESFKIDYVTSARDLLDESPERTFKIGTPVIFAAPDFDNPTESASGQETEQQLLVTRSRNAADIGKAKPLPGTLTEAEAFRKILADTSAGTPSVFLGSMASESNFKALSHPGVLVLSTHGFFLKSETAPSVDSGVQHEASRRDVPFIENPLLRCGLLLAGYNRDFAESEADDGLLTGLEILNTDLRGTELVVLSACDTALGDVQNGEGVAGLRQAFRLAGAEAVIATLWQIPDRESALLMAKFFNNLAVGKTKSESLRNAQLELIEKRRSRFGAAHPFYWAAFTLTGS